MRESLYTKSSTYLVSDGYNHPGTNLMTLQFAPRLWPQTIQSLQAARIEPRRVAGKDLYLIDGLFDADQSQEMRLFSRSAEFSKHIFATHETEALGEKPARAMDNKAKWRLLAGPLSAMQALYRLFGSIAAALDAQVSTLPWDLCEERVCAAAIATNFVEEVSLKTMALGIHRDYHPAGGIPFALPKLYGPPGALHEPRFDNGQEGRPWLISAMLYSTHEDFQPQQGMGTVFYEEDGTLAFRSDCRHMRLILFEGDLLHSIERSHTACNTWRVSYVFKLLVNPRGPRCSLKREFAGWLQSLHRPAGTTTL